MKYIFVLVLIVSIITPSFVLADEQVNDDLQTPGSPLLISELQVASLESSSEEFIELVNVTGGRVDVGGWNIEYMSSGGVKWSKKASLSGVLVPYGRVLAANYELDDDQLDLGSGIANTGGHIRITDDEGEVIDLITWGGATNPEGEAVDSPPAGSSAKRRLDEDGYFIDTDNNKDDFFISETPSPFMDNPFMPDDEEEIVPVEESQEPAVEEPDDELPVVAPAQPVYVPVFGLFITELVPDPVKPQVDSEHEMIELYNSSTETISLAGLIIEAGSRWQYDYALPSQVLGPGEYFSFYSADTSLTLSNSGGQVRILSPGGDTLNEVVYDKAKPGKSWAFSEGEWYWADPSPNLANIKLLDVLGASSDKDVSELEPDLSEPVEKRTVAYAKTSSSTKTDSVDDSTKYTFDEPPEDPVNNSILAGVGGLAVIYMIYEYRDEIRTYIKQFRRNHANRRKTRAPTKG